jgi:exodeoxyribonuclease-5
MDFGYAITCHKSQGSEWDHVLVLDESFGNDKARWQYTAATRASKTLTWV